MQDRFIDQNVIVPVGIVWIDAERIFNAKQLGIGNPELAVLARQTETPVPLPAHNLDLSCVFRNIHELGPDK